MNPDRTAWGDSRITAEFAQIREELHDLRPLPERVSLLTDEMRVMRDVPQKLAEIAVEFRGIRKDVGGCFAAIREAETKREVREDAQRKERKSDRRWMVGSTMTAASLVIGALALLADKL
jgi:hypothetical protein